MNVYDLITSFRYSEPVFFKSKKRYAQIKEALAEFEADMFTTVYIGNSRTKVIGGKMVTPRGYQVR